MSVFLEEVVPVPHPHAEWGNEPDEVIYQPIPLETVSDNADSSILSRPIGAPTPQPIR